MNEEKTPIEEYRINGYDIWVKRDDLFLASAQPMAPALAKLRGAKIVLERMKLEGITKIACFDTRISKSGQGIAYLCKELGIKCAVGYPKLKSQVRLNEPQQKAEQMGAEVWAVQAGRTAPCYAAFKREAVSQGYTVLPLGITFKETAQEIARVAKEEIGRFNTIVVSTGTGTIATGIALGTIAKVLGISCGMNIERQQTRAKKIIYEYEHLISYKNYPFPMNLEFIQTNYDYYQALDTSSCPFPTSPFYDMKAWVWLLEHFKELEQPVLFWNIGV